MALALSTLVCSFAVADEEHYDIGVWNDNGTLMTGGFDHDDETLAVQNLRVFEAEFGEDPVFPFSTDEPGVGGVAADMGLTEGTTIELNVSAGLGVWTGSGFNYGSANSMSIDYGPTMVDTLTGGTLNFLVTEDFDLHPIWSVNEQAAPGAYLVELTAAMTGYETSESFYVVFNLGLEEDDYEASVDWVSENLVPAPGVLALLGMGGLAVRRRRG
ncbi:MAG: hypothetical protein CMJ53_04985 [Planctomycetaceae bacterium]|nr:hypothetical protein [Planctomycetaceae bacterium]